MNKIVLLFASAFLTLLVVSCTSTNPFIDPAKHGADLPEVFYSADYTENLTYANLKLQEADALQTLDNKDVKKMRKTLLEAASFLRIAIKQTKLDVSIETHEKYQDILLQIAELSNASDADNIFVQRLLREYENFSKSDRTDADLHYLYARALYLSKDPENIAQAMIVGANAIKRYDKENYKIWMLLGTILADYRDYETAILYYTHAFQIRSDVYNTEALKLIAKAYESLGQYTKAISTFKDYIDYTRFNDLCIEDYENYANLHMKIGQLWKAAYILEKEVPSLLASSVKCKHLKLLGIIDLELAKKLEAEKSKGNPVALEKEKVLMVRSAKIAFELYLRFYPEDVDAKDMLTGLKTEYKMN